MVIPGLKFGACSHVGLVREVNEDSKLHDPPLFAVADGMGGHSAGDVASAMAIEALQQEVRDPDYSLTAAVRNANKVIYQKASTDPDLSGMGTTITAMYLSESSAKIVHVGDSRAYLLRGDELARITQDHTVVGRLVQQGRISPEDADRHPQRSYLERALGVDQEVEVDVYVLELSPGDRILLCSDGLFGMIDDRQILSAMKSESNPQRAAERLCEAAVQAGGSDNVTAVVVDYPESRMETYLPETSALPAPTTTTIPRRDTGPLGGGAGGGYGRDAPSTVAVPPQPRVQPRRAQDVRKDSGRTARIVALVTLTVVILAVAGWTVMTSIRNSWYVGTDQGRVTIFNGIQGSIAGKDLSKVDQRTAIETDSLPQLYQGRLRDGIEARSRRDAASIVEDLQRLVVAAPQPEPTPPPTAPGAAPAP